ncbi:hypothetical protein AB6813_02130 [bacterium RCC_150]
MKWCRWAHQLLFAASLGPLIMGVWDLWLRLTLPLAILVPYAVNEGILDWRRKIARNHAIELDQKDPMVHAYREPDTGSRTQEVSAIG